MLYKAKIWIFLLLCFSAREIYASHISGAEITYKHLVGSTYRFKLKVYRDCKECKFNGIGGGDNNSSCNEVPNLIIKGALGTSNSTTVLGNIEISRKSIHDITLACNSSISKCRPGSNLNIGYEVHEFEGDFDFSKLVIDGHCKLDVSISLSSRSVNINPQQSEQNFFNYTMINLCEALPNESVEFTANPQFVHYLNQSNFNALNVLNPDKDSLVFSLKPALANRNASINYENGRNSDMPFTYFCQSSGVPPCPVNLLGNLVEGFYCSKSNGDIAFTPTQTNQGGVMLIECEEWKKNALGVYYLAGVVRRDVYSEIISANNNLPIIKTKLGRYAICEGENLAVEINVEDLPFGLSTNDSVHMDLFSKLPGSSLEKIAVNYAPYFKYVFRVEPALGQIGEHTLTLTARDNHCPLQGLISKSFTVVVLQRRSLITQTEIENCGVLSAIASNYPNKLINWTLKDEQSNIIKQQNSKKLSLQLVNSGVYYLESILPAEKGFCEIRRIDTLNVSNIKTPVLNMGLDYNVCKGTDLNILPKYFETFDAYDLSVNGITITGFPYKLQANSNNSLSFKVTQKNGCSYEEILNIGLFNELKYKVRNDTICNNGIFPMPVENIIVDKSSIQKIDFTYSSNASVLSKQNPKDWTFDFINKSNPTAHKMVLYSVISDLNSCTYLDTSFIQVIEPSPITVNAPSKLCVNAEVYNLETKTGGKWECVNYPALVKNNQIKLNGASLNQLVLKYTEVNMCSNSKTFFVDLMDTTEVTFLHSKDLLFCENNALFELKALPSGGEWSGDGVLNGKFNPANFGGKKFKIQYQVSNQNNCISTSTIGVEVEKLPSLKVIAANESICVGGSLSLQALSSAAGNGYWYSDGAGRFDDASSQLTNYQPSTDDVLKSPIKFVYTIQTNGICGNLSSEVFAKIKNGPSGDIVNDFVDRQCEPANFVFKSTYANIEKQFWFINDSLVEEFDYNFNMNITLKEGEYVVKTKVADSTCEALAISKTITVLPTPQIEILSNPSSRLSHEYPRLFLKDKTTCKNGHSVDWYFNQTWISNSREFYYTVDDSKDTFTIKMVAESGIGACKDSVTQLYVFTPINQLYIPDAFSPDAKGPDENNKFKVKGPAMRIFEIEIFNKYGEKVFVSNSMNEAWDGTYKAVDCMMGVYFYKIITTDYDGISRDYSGTITLVR